MYCDRYLRTYITVATHMSLPSLRQSLSAPSLLYTAHQCFSQILDKLSCNIALADHLHFKHNFGTAIST